MKWILSKGLQQSTPRFIQQSSPLRYKAQRNTALDILIENHWVRMDKKDNHDSGEPADPIGLEFISQQRLIIYFFPMPYFNDQHRKHIIFNF